MGRGTKRQSSIVDRLCHKSCLLDYFWYTLALLFTASAFARSTSRRVASFNGGTVEGTTNLTSVGLFLYSSLAYSLDR